MASRGVRSERRVVCSPRRPVSSIEDEHFQAPSGDDSRETGGVERYAPPTMAKIRPISGFPEWSPAEQLVENQALDTIRRRFELFGFAPIETRAVEPLEVEIAQ